MQVNTNIGSLFAQRMTSRHSGTLQTTLARLSSGLRINSARDDAESIATLHRALEWSPLPSEDGGPFRRGPAHPLRASLVLVDEASMADVELMAHLVAALRPGASLLLLGDRDVDSDDESLNRSQGAMMQGEHRFARGKYFHAFGKEMARREGWAFGWSVREVLGVAHDNGGIARAAGDLVDGVTACATGDREG